MIATLQFETPTAARDRDEPDHILLATADRSCRQGLAAQLQRLGYRVTAVPGFGVVELLRARGGAFDLMITAQSPSETALFGLPQLARSVDPELPILVLAAEAASGLGLETAVRDSIRRWPLRDRPARTLN